MVADVGLVTDPDEAVRYIEAVRATGRPFGVDCEAGYHGADRPGASLKPEIGFVVGFSLAPTSTEARYIPVAHDDGPNVDAAAVVEPLARLLATGLGVAHNAKTEIRHLSKLLRQWLTTDRLAAFGLDPTGRFPVYSDTMLESYMLAETTSNALKHLTWVVFGYEQAGLDSLLAAKLSRPPTEREKKAIRFNVFDPTDPAVTSYACDDAWAALALHHRHYPRVTAPGFPGAELFRVECGLVPHVSRMEDVGVCVDWDAMRAARDEAVSFRDALDDEIQTLLTEATGEQTRINLGSPPQVAGVLFGKLGLTPGQHSDKTGNPSTSEKSLETTAKTSPVVRRILEWREINRLVTSYLDKLEADCRFADDDRAHPDHLQHGAISGRFAVSGFPYQQLPKKYHYVLDSGRVFHLNFRDFIVAAPGHYLVEFDWDAMEFRVLAALSGEERLVEVFRDGLDIHVRTAAMVFDKDPGACTKRNPGDVTESERHAAKGTGYGLCYGQGAKGLADTLGIPVSEATSLLNGFFDAYPKVRRWADGSKAFGHRFGRVESWFGRRLPIWEFDSDKPAVRAKGERLCMNSPIQGAAADLFKACKLAALRAVDAAGLGDEVRCVMTVHDALVFEVHESVPPQDVISVVHPKVTPRVPGWPELVADWAVGLKWGSMTKVPVSRDGRIMLDSTHGQGEHGQEPDPVESASFDQDGPDLGRPVRITVDSDHLHQLADYLAQRPGTHPLTVRLADSSEPVSVCLEGKPVAVTPDATDGLHGHVPGATVEWDVFEPEST